MPKIVLSEVERALLAAVEGLNRMRIEEADGMMLRAEAIRKQAAEIGQDCSRRLRSELDRIGRAHDLPAFPPEGRILEEDGEVTITWAEPPEEQEPEPGPPLDD